MAITPVPVQLQNKAAQARDWVCVHGITFAPGEMRNTGTPLAITGASAAQTRVQWMPKGRRWPDGSVRYAKVAFKASLTATQEKTATISELALPTTAFAAHASVMAGLPNTTVTLTVNGTPKAYTLDLAGFTLVEGGGAGDEYATYERFDRVAAHPATLAIIWLRMRIQIPRGLPYVRFWFSWGNSYAQDGRNGDLGGNTKFVLTSSPTLVIEGPANFGVNVRSQANKMAAVGVAGTTTTYTLIDHTQTALRNEKLPFGTRHTYRGAMKFDTSDTGTAAAGASSSDAWGFAMDWTATGKGPPPYGMVPQYPPFITSRTDGITRLKTYTARYETNPTNDPYFKSDLMLGPNTTIGGAQGLAFAAPWRGHAMFRTGHPHMLDVLLRDSYQMGNRPNWFVEPDGSRWVSDDLHPETTHDHPDAWIWDGTYIHTALDWFGQTSFLSRDTDTPVANAPGSPLWWGPDRQHWSEIWEAMALLATWDDGLEDLMLGRVETWIGMHYTDRGFGGAGPNPDASRARGRGTMKTGALLLECTGDVRVEYWLRQRVRLYWSVVNNNLTGTYFRSTRLLEATDPKGAAYGLFEAPGGGGVLLTENSWNPWQESIAAEGLLGAANVLAHGNPADPDAVLARNMAFEIAMTTTMRGFFDNRPGSSTRIVRVTTATIDGPQGTASMDGVSGMANVNGRVLRGATGSGTIWLVWKNFPDPNAAHRQVYLYNATGTFGDNEALTVDDSSVVATTTASPIQNWLGGMAQRAYTSENYREATDAELRETFIHTNGEWEPRNAKWYTAYAQWTYPAAVVARIGVEQNYYGARNAEVKAQADLIIGAYVTENRDFDSGDWQNDFEEYNALALTSTPGGGTKPFAPSALTAIALTQTTVRLEWRDESDNESSFELQHSVDGTNWLPAGEVPANITTHIVIGLSADTLYEFRARALNAAGESAWSNIAQATTPPVGGSIPNVPSDLAAVAASSAQINVTWQDNSNDETGFQIRYSEVDGEWRYFLDVDADVESAVIGGLEASTTYYFQVRAFNETGTSDWTESVNATTDSEGGILPAPPTNVRAVSTGATTATVTWDDNSDNEASFRVERSTDGATWVTAATPAANVESFDDTGLTTGTVYLYRVFAVNAFGETTDGSIATVAPGGGGSAFGTPSPIAAILPALFHAQMFR